MITFLDAQKQAFKLQTREIRAIRHKVLFMNQTNAAEIYYWLEKTRKIADPEIRLHYLPQIRTILSTLCCFIYTGESVLVDGQYHQIFKNPKPRIVTFREKNGYIEFMEHFLGLDGEK